MEFSFVHFIISHWKKIFVIFLKLYLAVAEIKNIYSFILLLMRESVAPMISPYAKQCSVGLDNSALVCTENQIVNAFENKTLFPVCMIHRTRSVKFVYYHRTVV